MNKRIQELAEKAKLSVPHGIMGVDKWIEAYNERLGALVIQECVGIVEKLSPGYDDYRNQIEDAFRRDCMEEIKQHFGVDK